MIIENSIEDGIDFFHMDALSSAVAMKVDCDLQLTLMASSLYRLLAGRIGRGYEQAKSRHLFRDFVDATGVIAPVPRVMRLFWAFCPSNPPESPSQEESSFASMLDALESKSRSDGPPAGPRSIGLLPDSRSFLTVSVVA